MPRIPLDTGFRILLTAGLTPDAALDLIAHETTRQGGSLSLWCNGNLLPQRYIAKDLYFQLDTEGCAIAWPFKSYVFELDGDQVEALVAKLQVKPKRRGRPPKEVDAAAIEATKERRRAEKKPVTQAKLAEQLGVSKSTIRRREQKK